MTKNYAPIHKSDLKSVRRLRILETIFMISIISISFADGQKYINLNFINIGFDTTFEHYKMLSLNTLFIGYVFSALGSLKSRKYKNDPITNLSLSFVILGLSSELFTNICYLFNFPFSMIINLSNFALILDWISYFLLKKKFKSQYINLNNYNILAKYYDRLMPARFYDNYKSFIERIIGEDKLKNLSVLDIACGTGTLLRKLDVSKKIGTDLSQDMLNIAKNKFNDDENVKLIRSNMNDLGKLGEFDLILNCNDSVNYLSNENEIIKFWKSVKENLSNKGFFIFDFNTLNFYSSNKDKILKNNVELDDVELIWQDHFFDNKLEISFQFLSKSGKNIFKEKHLQKGYSDDFIKTSLSNIFKNFEIEFYNNKFEQIDDFSNEGKVYVVCSRIKNED